MTRRISHQVPLQSGGVRTTPANAPTACLRRRVVLVRAGREPSQDAEHLSLRLGRDYGAVLVHVSVPHHHRDRRIERADVDLMLYRSISSLREIMEPWGFEPQIPPCHGGVIPFHYGPGIDFAIFRQMAQIAVPFFVPKVTKSATAQGCGTERETLFALGRMSRCVVGVCTNCRGGSRRA